MRIVPVLTAIVVMFGMYAIVFERPALLAFALGDAAAQQAEPPAPDFAKQDSTTVAVRDAAPEMGVVVMRLQARTVDSAIVLRGQTRAARQVEVRAETSATVISEPLRKGILVSQGDLLCKLDPGTRAASLAQARAALTEARSRVPQSKARLIEARAKLDEARNLNSVAEKLSKDGYASETRLISTKAAMRSAEAGIATAEWGLESVRSGIEAAAASVAAAEREIARLSIFAPFEGLLESDTAELGSLMQPGSLCATVIQLDPIKLTGYVPETTVNRVRVGALAGARLAAGQQVQGQVTFLSRSADPTTRTFLVEITVPNPDLAIRDGQTAEIAIAAPGEKAHRLPQSALTLNNDGKLGVRVVDADNIVQFMPVSLLRDDVDGIWVRGLPEQVDVIVVGQDFVVQGVRVNPTYREAAQ
jgi:membrane fusion protein, multidrug efflux system